MNYNLQIIASDAVLTKLVNDTQTTTGPVSDWILGAAVSGTENTTATVGVKLLPSNEDARMELVINGITQSNTVGVASQATVYTYGYHRWGAAEPLQFDGLSITAGPARMTYVQPSNSTQGVDTNVGGFLFHGIAQRIAESRVEEQRGESEAIAAQRLQSRVVPQFEARVADMVRDTNSRLQNDLRKRLKEAGVLPEDIRLRSNDSYLRMSAQIIKPGTLAGDVLNTLGNSGAGLIVNLHETLVNDAISNMKFAGETMTDDQVKAELERYFTLLAGQPIHLDETKAAATAATPAGANVPPPAPGTAPPANPPAAAPASDESNGQLVFDKEDPIRVLFENGEVRLIFRAGFKQPGKEDIPTQIITVPVKLSVSGNRVVIDRGTVEIAPATQTDRAQQVIRAGVMRKKIESVIKPMNRDGVIHVKRKGRSDVDLVISNVGAENGWLTIWAN
jgi:hypothetical protein